MKKRRRRQRRAISVAVIVIAILMIIGLAGYLFLQKNNNQDETAGIDIPATSSTETTKSDEAEPSSETSENTYESLINGTGKLSFDYYKKNVYIDNEYQSYQDEFVSKLTKDDYTISELVEDMNAIFSNPDNYYAEGKVESVEYAYLDCGNDGNKEMVLRFTCPIVEEASSIEFILKEMDEKIQVVYSYCNWSRSETSINYQGFISGGGSNGASNHGYDCGIIKADGSYSYGYYEEEESDLSMLAYRYGVEDLDTSSLSGNIVVYSLQTEKSTADKMAPIVFSYLVYDDNYNEITDIPNLYTDSDYQRLIDTIPDAQFIPYDEFQSKINAKLDSIGATQAVIGSNQLQYNKINL
ncbi:hypothetical protein [Pseudobutyrivibrio xylanivorans]|uniref:Uncharacterized protein n=1 Tax=Pseudobutyrivibrio xylanivorans TaxID=185007 RepID=A0A1G5RWT7_PSEXY|nr:hypothetical protein [Pseudobutyrivibrio xylanivorans]SCZ78516.1 hypothetical protein SAMN02910350_01327 [Pseudobutyrivibrio xylanivorans]